jgi:hypothetical protein
MCCALHAIGPSHEAYEYILPTSLHTLTKFELVKVWFFLHMPRRRVRGGTAPLIFYLGTRWECMVSFTPQPFYPRGKSLRHPLNRRLGASHSQTGRFGKEKISYSAGIWIPGRPVVSPVNTPIMLSPLLTWIKCDWNYFIFSYETVAKQENAQIVWPCWSHIFRMLLLDRILGQHVIASPCGFTSDILEEHPVASAYFVMHYDQFITSRTVGRRMLHTDCICTIMH